MGIPVYIFNGFLESGKTQFIKDTLLDPGFTENEKTLIVACEDGEEEYEEIFLKETNSVLLQIDSKEDFTGVTLKKAAMAEKPDRIVIEYNGMWEISLIEQEFPHDWELYQIITTINAETYEVYLKNMGSKIIEHVSVSEMVVFNRCTPELSEYIRTTNVKAMNPRALIFLEDNSGEAENYNEGLPLPFDIDAPVIDVKDEDYGIFYVDAMNEPAKYEGKTVKMLVQLHRRPEDLPNRFAGGRFAMVCCADDISFLAFYCDMKNAKNIVEEEGWARIEAKIKVEYYPEMRDDGPVMYITDFKPVEKPEEDLVYFR
jgi:uncharacterized membrane protein YcgQ (UPF0703/DUF1980 family)